MRRFLSCSFCFFYLLAGSCTLFSQQPKLIMPIGHSERIVSAQFNRDGKLALTVSTDGTAKLWETESGKLLRDFKSAGDASIVLVTAAWFTPGGKKVVIEYEGIDKRFYDIASGQLSDQILELDSKDFAYTDNTGFSPDRKKVLLIATQSGRLWVMDIETMKPVFILTTPKSIITSYLFSNDERKLVTLSSDNSFRIWDAATGKALTMAKTFPENVSLIGFSWDDKKIVFKTENNSVLIIDALTGKTLSEIISSDGQNASPEIPASILAPGGKICINLFNYHNFYDEIRQVQYWDSLVVCDRRTGKTIYSLNDLLIPSTSDFISPDGNKFLVLKKDSSVSMIDAATGKQLFVIAGDKEPVNIMGFYPDGKRFITVSGANPVRTWDAQTGQLISSLGNQPAIIYDARFSADSRKLIIGYEDKIARIWDLVQSKPNIELRGRAVSLLGAQFDSSGQKIIIQTTRNKLIFDLESGNLSVIDTTAKELAGINWHSNARGHGEMIGDSLIFTWIADIISLENIKINRSYDFWNEEKEINNAVFLSHDNKKILATSANNTIKLYDIENSKPILRFAVIDSLDYLVTDSSNRYDGTEEARKLLYFTCGNEVIGLDQVKDQLWVPNLAQRVKTGDVVNAKTLDEIGICGLTPVVEQAKGITNEYYFKIKPRRGGLGETILSINGTPTYSYQPKQLKKVGVTYELKVKKAEVSNYFIEGQENIIAVKAYTANNTSSSHNLTILEDPDKEKRLPPNLYAVMVGVSDYKGDNLDLDYAAVDATDISKTLSTAARKLLGDDHVFMYNLTTDKVRFLLPEKKSIKAVFEEIGKKATANDILFIFLSGHGVVGEKTKQYYYLTADASSAAEESSFPDVGISTAELTEWIKPQNIKAQKRILILDACYSGQAINSFVKIGNDKQGFLAARGDDKSQQLRAIDKLNEKSGLFILSASSSDQRAWESGVYSHGYLTYSLLKAIKLQPDILKEGKYLDVGRWLDAAGESVSEMAKDDGSKQQPQIVSSTNFQIGLVDEEVMSKINLSDAKPLFTSGNFLNNDEAIGDDDLDLRRLTDKKLEFLSRAEGGKKIFFLPSTNSPDAYSLTGSYTVKENAITVRVKLKQDKIIKKQFDLPGTKGKLDELVDAIISKAIEWIETNK
jgi:WD40 repeat protein/uncharacterized caspase-like protein